MTTETSVTETTTTKHGDRATIGIALIAIGIVLLLGNVIDTGLLILPALAIIFTAVGIRTRCSGWFIPAGILGGIGLGAILTDVLPLTEEAESGVFLLSFAVGWTAIPLLSALFAHERVWWPFIPGGIMAAIGSLLIIGESGVTLLEVIFNQAGWVWPLVLIVIGLGLIWRRHAD
ncbi:MAG: hypothetical protein WHS83_11325 [Chloroflexus sp.]|uniref:hypothetical protein n=1 Tax=Chloroflexus sp. TaxID=1904827 RepID=UPI003097B560